MDLSQFGAKELYDVTLRVRNQETIDNQVLEPNEPLATFQKIQYGVLNESTSLVHAQGGHGNQVLVSWKDVHEVHFKFSQGIFTKRDLALLSNSALETTSEVAIPTIEYHKVDETNKIRLKHMPIDGTLFIYYARGQKKMGKLSWPYYYHIDGQEVTFTLDEIKFSTVKVIYNYSYTNKNETIYIGKPMINGYLELTGKTTLVDDITGKKNTAIIRIPKMEIASDFSIMLGLNVTPMKISFEGVGYPIGPRKHERVMEITILDTDIDAD